MSISGEGRHQGRDRGAERGGGGGFHRVVVERARVAKMGEAVRVSSGESGEGAHVSRGRSEDLPAKKRASMTGARDSASNTPRGSRAKNMIVPKIARPAEEGTASTSTTPAATGHHAGLKTSKSPDSPTANGRFGSRASNGSEPATVAGTPNGRFGSRASKSSLSKRTFGFVGGATPLGLTPSNSLSKRTPPEIGKVGSQPATPLGSKQAAGIQEGGSQPATSLAAARRSVASYLSPGLFDMSPGGRIGDASVKSSSGSSHWSEDGGDWL